MIISLIHPSRGRPAKAHSNLLNWESKWSKKHEIQHILSIDSDDPTRDEYYNSFKNSTIIKNSNEGVVSAANHAAKEAKGGILLYLSDDFDCPDKWDELIVQKLADKEKAILRVNDLLQPMTNQVLTIPIMTKALYDELGYFFYPGYKSLWCDVDLYWRTLHYLIIAPELHFKHLHYSQGHTPIDSTYERSERNMISGLELYNERARAHGWPLK